MPRRRVRFGVGRLVDWCVRLVGLAVVVVLVVGIGVGLRTPEVAPPSYSTSEQAQLAAETRYRSLADDARAAASADPGTAELLLAIASDLEVQTEAVALPRGPDPSSASGPSVDPSNTATEGATAATDPSPAVPPADGPRVLDGLRSSALTSLADAVDADAGPARVLASAGAHQWQRALDLAAALGTDAGLPPADPTTAAALDDGSGPFAAIGESETSPDTGRTNQGTDACVGTPLGTSADRQALLDAWTAEARALYGYEFAAALLPGDAATLERLAEHDAAASAASKRLAELCEVAGPAPAGFTLAPNFRADPVGELRRLEEQHVDLYAGSVAGVSPETREWAVMGLVGAVLRSVDAGAALRPLPGIEAAQPSDENDDDDDDDDDAAATDPAAGPTGSARGTEEQPDD